MKALGVKPEIAEATGSVAQLRHDSAWVVVAEASECRSAGVSGRAAEERERPRRLTPEERDAIRLLADTRSLRDLAADFGVSHETIRAVVRTSSLPGAG